MYLNTFLSSYPRSNTPVNFPIASYVLAILSNLEGEENEDYALFKEISYLVEDYIENNRTDSVTSPTMDE